MTPFLHYAHARVETNERDLSYRVYVTDALQGAPQQKYLQTRWAEFLVNTHADDRSGDEVAADIIRRAGLTLKVGE